MSPAEIKAKKSELRTKAAIFGLLAIAIILFLFSLIPTEQITPRDIWSLVGLGLVTWMTVFIISRRILYRRNGFKIPPPPGP